MPILISSFDHDGCLASNKFKTISELIAAQKVLFDGILSQYGEEINGSPYFTAHKVMIGSNRQSFNVDCINAIKNGNGMVMPLAQAISTRLNAEFDELTLADIKAKKKPGYHTKLFLKVAKELGLDLDLRMHFAELTLIHKFIEKFGSSYRFSDFDYSEDKINILYAQIHHQASLYPDEEITFNFFDDKRSILNSLYEFFKKFPELLPENIQLNLYLYNQFEFCLLYPSIYGQNFIDFNYYETVNIMAQIAKSFQGDNPINGYTMASFITPIRIEEAREANQALKAKQLLEQTKKGQTFFFNPEPLIYPNLTSHTLC